MQQNYNNLLYYNYNKYDHLADIHSFPTSIYNFVVALFSFNS